MARILIGWELGAGRGHGVSMRLIADALARRGHDVILAGQRTDLPIHTETPLIRYQAPLWPGLLKAVETKSGHVATLFDILARLGLARPRVLAGMIGAWDAILAASRADLVVVDHAPALMAAARGRVPVIAVGPGFQVPHVTEAPPARVGGGEPGFDEAQLLDTIDAELRAVGRAALPHLSALVAVDAPLVSSFPELDPYRRTDANARFIAPGLDGVAPPVGKPGDEVFVYAANGLQESDAFWAGLVSSRLPIRAHVPGATAETRSRIAKMGVKVEAHPLPMAQIVARSRVNVNHGAHGIVCAMLLAGIPQLMLPLDLEKHLHSEAVDREGLGLMRPGNALTPVALGEALRSLWDDAAIAGRTRSAAPAFNARMAVPYGEAVADVAASLL